MSKLSHEKVYRKAYYETHRAQCQASVRAWNARNRDKVNAYQRAYKQRPEVKAKNKERLKMPGTKAKKLAYSRKYQETHRDQGRKASLAWRYRNREKANAIARAWRKKPGNEARIKEQRTSSEARAKALLAKNDRYHRLRVQAIENYGGKCACCGEEHLEFLVIDHANGGGNKERRMRKISPGAPWYFYLVTNHPDHLRVLCQNCNSALSNYGHCPHQTKEKPCRK